MLALLLQGLLHEHHVALSICFFFRVIVWLDVWRLCFTFISVEGSVHMTCFSFIPVRFGVFCMALGFFCQESRLGSAIIFHC